MNNQPPHFPADLALRDLEGVAGVADHAGFGRAAAALRIAQPTLSAQVQKVERALGARLFERSARRFLITPAGEALLPHIRETLAAARRLHDAASARAAPDAPPPPIRLGVIPTLGPYLMPRLLLRASRAASAPRLALTEQTTAHLLDALREGALDAALLSLPIPADTLEVIPLFDEPFRLIAPAASPILRHERLSPAHLAASEMVLLEEGHCLRGQALALCGRRGQPSPRLVTTSLETLKYLVAAGEGYSLLPLTSSAVPQDLANLVVVRAFDARPPSRRIALCFRRSAPDPAALRALASFIRRHCPPGSLEVQPGPPPGTTNA